MPAAAAKLCIGLLCCALLYCFPIAAVADGSLPSSVQSVLKLRKIPAESLSVLVTDIESGKTIVKWNDDVPRNPASTMKLVTTLVALDELGPAYHWKTEIYGLSEIRDGRLDGDLLIKGYGDPFLVTERVWRMVRDLSQTGLHEIGGDLIIDDSYFDVGPYDAGQFDHQPLRAYNVAPNALLMNLKVVRYWFEPDPATKGVRVVIEPALENLQVENRLSLANGSCSGYQRGISITAADSFTKMILDGSFPSRCKNYAISRTALDHNAYAYGMFKSMWKEAGNSFEGTWRKGIAPTDRVPLISFPSKSLAEIITLINKHSNNVMARQLLYTLSAETFGAPGTEQGGREVISAWAARNLSGLDSLVLENGAGLSRAVRISARDFNKLLRFAWSQPYMPEFAASMPLSGLDGTLKSRFDDGTLTGQAHLKTGSLDDVSAIAGYLQARSGRRFAVTVLLNYKDAHRGPGEEVQTALLRYLNDL
ncbi:MAG TPA: D-alanyl-D-alanine carboxypeptidase/D-alanyl-D-alanine-endopeptidase [Woeseiaceae bacterium]|nr:D-alanyl-D-alanine carboxypeptidase/D-alanyl-D-alanine-endopeptidase [Woeseiaceae bacterium]